MGNSNQAQAAIDHRLLLDYRNLNCAQDVDSKWEQMILSLMRVKFKTIFAKIIKK